MYYCGIWATKHRLFAGVVDERGVQCGPGSVAGKNEEELWCMIDTIETHHGLDSCVVLTDELLQCRADLALMVQRRHGAVLIAPAVLVRQLRVLGGLGQRASPKKMALLLARLPLCGSVYHRLSHLAPYLDNDIL